jgi:hypothetical protein
MSDIIPYKLEQNDDRVMVWRGVNEITLRKPYRTFSNPEVIQPCQVRWSAPGGVSAAQSVAFAHYIRTVASLAKDFDDTVFESDRLLHENASEVKE